MSGAGERPDVAVLVSYSGDGGVERMINQLLGGLVAAGCRVEVLVLRAAGAHSRAIPSGVRVARLPTRHAALAAPAIAWYLRRRRPRALLAAKDRAGRAALRARGLAGVPTRVVLRLGNTLGPALERRGRLWRWWRCRPLRRLYPRADAIVAVSAGVAEDVIATAGVDPARVHVVPNPVITPAMDRAATEPVAHPWCDGAAPLVLAIGRLARQKDFPTLLRAFARLRAHRALRLAILGEGEERGALERLVGELGLGDAVVLPGFVDNPHAWLAHARLFVLSSAWEGSPNALTEALHLGVPVVATDCRSGPREILDDGRVGRLVPVGDAAALAAAMQATLDAPPEPGVLRAAVAGYTVERSTAGYLEVLGITGEAEPC
jgi:glycosyltransferase involved in cell wall biosynthesis